MAAQARRIMVAYDGSAASRRALDAAAGLAGYGSTLSVLTPAGSTAGRSAGSDARAWLQRRQIEARYHEVGGDPIQRLIERAGEAGADLLVVGRPLSEQELRRARCDVLVVRQLESSRPSTSA